MSVIKSKKTGKFLYAIVQGEVPPGFGAKGVGGGQVFSISNGPIAAIVSDVPNRKLRPERRNLAAHHDVLKNLVRETTPLPVAFGVIADDTLAVKEILASNHDAFMEEMDRVEGKIEMGLRVSWDVPNIFNYFIGTHPELRKARDNYMGTRGNASHEDKIELGRLFDRLLRDDRENYTFMVEDVLMKHCSEVKRDKCRSEKDVMNLACLVNRDDRQRFEAGVFEAARLFDNNYSFEYNGPWAPHNFVELDLSF